MNRHAHAPFLAALAAFLALPVFGQTSYIGGGGAGGGSGTVESVALTAPAQITVTGSPITESGTLALTWAAAAQNTIFAGPSSGGAGTPLFRSLVSADLPATIAASTTGNAATATALETNPAPCDSGDFVTDMDANGTLICDTPAGGGGLPQNSQSAAYTTVLGDAGKHIYHPSADTTPRTWTIDSNANVAYVIGTTITFVNDCSAGAITLAVASDTMILAGTGASGSRTLSACGIATALKIGTTRWLVSGSGIS